MLITPIEAAWNVLGMPLYVDYYSIHDPETGIIGWAPNSGSEKGSVKFGTVPPSSQFLEVRFQPTAPRESIDWIASFSAWAITLIFIGLW